MISFPNAKINLGLHVIEKRTDGYHNIETIFYPVPFTDVLEVLPSADFFFQSTGLSTECARENNLAVKAYRLLQEKYNLPAVKIHLHKIIPPGAGLGGGSSDAAYMLKMLNHLFSIGITEEKLREYAVQLGSDCPFFITNQPVIATGRGEVMTPLTISLHQLKIVLVIPPVGINTASAYRVVKPRQPEIQLREAIEQPVDNWKFSVTNDFEKGAFASYPEIAVIKHTLLEQGARYASLSGSGSALFGLFEEIPTRLTDHLPNCRIIFPA